MRLPQLPAPNETGLGLVWSRRRADATRPQRPQLAVMLRITSRQKSLRPAEYLVLASQSLTTLILHYFKLFTKFVVSCATAPLPPCPTSSQPLRTGSQPDSDSIPHASTLNFNAHSVQTLTCSHTRATPPRHCSQCRAGTATPTLKKKSSPPAALRCTVRESQRDT